MSVRAVPDSGGAPPELDDLDLVRRVVAGDAGAFELLMRRHNRRLYRVARALLRDPADAEDVVQEAYLAAYTALGEFRGEASLGTWLSRIVVNRCTARLRRQARRDGIVRIVSDQLQFHGDEDADDRTPATAALPDDEASPERAMARAELRALLERRIDALPEVFRTVFVLRCVEDLSVEETARSLQIPEATVRTRHFRARALLRETLAQELDAAERDVFGFAGERCDRIVARVLAQLPPR